jgi:cytidylate kinase
VTRASKSRLSGLDRHLVVAIDGPSSSGKSTVGGEVAQRLGYRFCDTGLLYRAVAWLAVERGVSPDDVDGLVPLASEVELTADERGRLLFVRAAGRDVTDEVCGPDVDRVVSDYAKVPELREALVARQRDLAAKPGIIMVGRDIGTVILPDADLKIFLLASPEERARRRAIQRSLDESGAEAQAILADMRRRDAIDSRRTAAPLRPAEDALRLDTDGRTFDETVDAVLAAVRDVRGARGPLAVGGGRGAGRGRG